MKSSLPILGLLLAATASLRAEDAQPCGNAASKNPPTCPAPTEGGSGGSGEPAGGGGDFSPPSSDSVTSPTSAGVSSGFNTFTGNSNHGTSDLSVYGAAGENGLNFQRQLNTRPGSQAAGFGTGAEWRHNYQWDLANSWNQTVTDPSGATRTPPAMQVVAPNGNSTRYVQSLHNPNLYLPPANQGEELRLEGEVWVLTPPEGNAYKFHRTGSSFRLKEIVDPYGLSLHLDYDTQNRLSRVREPSGGYIDIERSTIKAANATTWTTVYTVPTDKVGDNVWLEFTVASTGLFNHVRYVSPDGRTQLVSEFEVYAHGGTQKLTGTYFSTAASDPAAPASVAFDGDTATSFSTSATSGGMVGINIGTSRRLGTIRIFIPPGGSAAGARFEAMSNRLAPRDTITSVVSSDGRRVNYDYTLLPDPGLPELSYAALTAVRYPAGSVSTNVYEFQRPATPPVIRQLQEPKLADRATTSNSATPPAVPSAGLSNSRTATPKWRCSAPSETPRMGIR